MQKNLLVGQGYPWFLGNLYFLFFFHREIGEIGPFRGILRALVSCRDFFCIKTDCTLYVISKERITLCLKVAPIDDNHVSFDDTHVCRNLHHYYVELNQSAVRTMSDDIYGYYNL